ncbi:DUF4082 domain-containing protein [Nocardioides sp. STR2]|uniref:DUF4082 domain-containing protein n=1 Tax=Nocardioides pini TaxID=2975053 RepID=A0ABT4CDB6_9ACTN|nr:DUF4082 domain-containing protein [Nocardioides pini]MCY4726965.1 DUF4082 domain-containing protein [Nocardioides pini]
MDSAVASRTVGLGRAWTVRLLVLAVVAALNALLGPASLGGPAPANAADPCAPGGNKIACENSKPGTDPAVWDAIWGAGDESIQGFSTDISVNVGQRIDFKIKTDASAYTIDIYRIGYYQGNGARKITSVTPSASLPQSQPNCISDLTTETYDCGNWAVSASWNVPSTAVSGIYIAHLKRGNGDASHITFVVRDDASTSDVIFQTSDTTWQAYNTYGGSDFYRGGANGRAYKVSYNRPVLTRGGIGGRDFFFANEYPMVRFLERNGYDVSYMAGVDSDRRGQLIKNHRVFLSVGHDEYWSGAQRANVEAARDAGVNLQFLSGNEVYWRTRYEPSMDSSHTPYRTLVTYKETWDRMKSDPAPQWTGTWRDPRYAPTSQGAGRPENALTGTMYQANYSDLPVTVSAEEGKYRLWRNTSLASLTTGQSRQLAPHTVGYESNEDIDNGHRPAGLVRLSTTVGPTPEYLRDYGNSVTPGTTTHNLTLYRATSGALVFSAGSVQWTWGLDGEHDSPFLAEPPDIRMQQAQVNLLADMNAQPSTLMGGLVTATKSTDTTGPTVTITSPAAGATIANGTQRTVNGTATDVGGGRVAGVEVSTNGGDTWHPATGTTSWSYSYVQKGMGTVAVRVRASDDSANIGSVATRNVNVSCPCSIFGAEVPPVAAADDSGAVELGLRFTPTSDGYISGVRFYKGTGNGGSHKGSLWSSSGAQLATGTFANETTTGWQTLNFTSPVPVIANQTYVASYTAPQGRYALGTDAFWAASRAAPPLTVPGGFGSAPSGVFGYAGLFPANSYQSSNYYVDVLFTTVDNSPLVTTSQWPVAGSTSVPANTTVRATFSKPITPGSATIVVKDALDQTVAGSSAYDATTRTITFTPSAPLASFVEHTATVSATDSLGQQVSAGKTWTFRTAKPPTAPGVCPCSLFDDGSQPSVLEDSDQSPVTLGVRFSSSVDGSVTAIRFFKGPNNTGSHVGTLWSANGTQLATGTFNGESTSGWQTLVLSTPVTITKNTDYIASYRAPAGRYSVTPNGFSSGSLSRSPLNVASNAGAYTYGTGFPSNTSPSNYMVDVVFEKAPAPLTVTGQSPAPGATQVGRGSQVVLEVSTPLASGYSVAVTSGGMPVPGTTTLGAGGTRLTFTPTSTLPAGATINVVASGLTSIEGATLVNQSWSFQTRSSEPAEVQNLFGSVTPANATNDDSSPVELGVEFTPTKAGQVTGIRFFKGAGNNGVHQGSLWSASGTKLAGVTFVGETDSGWQTAMLSTPVDVTAGTPYVVSYFAPQGHYATTAGFFNNQWVSGDLRSSATTNGRYRYGASGGFPQFSWNATNYFVDVLFEKTPSAVTIASRTPDAGATGVVADVLPRITFSDAITATGWSMTVKQGSTSVPGSASLSSDGTQITFDPTADLTASTTYSVEVAGVKSADGIAIATESWSFTTAASTAPVSRLLDGLTPAAHVQENDPLELGMAFSTSSAGSVTGVRFWKGPGSSGTHTGSLWNSAGTRLGTVTFANESTDGWQTAEFSSPIAVGPGQEYVVSYYSPSGDYSVTGAYFSQARTVGPLTAPAGDNGRYRYGSGGGFPTGSWNSTNYFVDVLFRQAP